MALKHYLAYKLNKEFLPYLFLVGEGAEEKLLDRTTKTVQKGLLTIREGHNKEKSKGCGFKTSWAI